MRQSQISKSMTSLYLFFCIDKHISLHMHIHTHNSTQMYTCIDHQKRKDKKQTRQSYVQTADMAAKSWQPTQQHTPKRTGQHCCQAFAGTEGSCVLLYGSEPLKMDVPRPMTWPQYLLSSILSSKKSCSKKKRERPTNNISQHETDCKAVHCKLFMRHQNQSHPTLS